MLTEKKRYDIFAGQGRSDLITSFFEKGCHYPFQLQIKTADTQNTSANLEVRLESVMWEDNSRAICILQGYLQGSHLYPFNANSRHIKACYNTVTRRGWIETI
ncbi:TPA: hypothetical protein DD449_02085 [Candidatus Berkelbacteria bacterium]|uniref:Uncharacterized protein n=1 Tax=Berkelbacteria bacterium GW2011_GWE1_39_12 TaxID=1618337 RepID=A0A0G4B1P1_9BACT|nr:MAG: hypothetical protein UT28_C0001G0057 [Berkelbacteria bacterium GW2011_GWE1_39_12]HBO60448.1 hypothetical protein [Candidatus Berkelbacteria bacterium]